MTESAEFFDCIKNLSKEIIKKGENTRKASDGTVCCVEFAGISGNFSESVHLSATTSTITIGAGCETVDRVIEYCIQTMKISEESCFSVSCAVWNLKFTAKLENCFFKPYCFQMTDVEKMSLARAFKDQGVTLFKKEKVTQAFQKFRKALQYVLLLSYPSGSDEEHPSITEELDLEEVSTFIVNIYNNLAMCQLQYKNYESVIPLCEKSLIAEPNVKAYYRRAMALISKEEYELAEEDLLELLKLDGENKAAKDKLSFVQSKLKPSREQYKETVRKMFS